MSSEYSIHLITFYSDRRYRKAAYRLKKQAQESKLFSSVIVWNPKLILAKAPGDYENLMKLRHLISPSVKGYGLWFWKPVIIEQTLRSLPQKSILIYLDAGCYLNLTNSSSIARFHKYLRLTIEHGSLAMQLNDLEFGIPDLSENVWTSRFVMDGLGVRQDLRTTNQIQAGIQFLKSDSRNIEFVSKWRTHCEENDFSYLIGSKSHATINLTSHRYDQSIFSCLYKMENRFTLPDETYFDPDWISKGKDYPIWAMRNRDGISPFEFRISDLFARILRRLTLLNDNKHD